MAVTSFVLGLLGLLGDGAARPPERSVVAEWETTIARSTEGSGVSAGSAALRIFGEPKPGLRFFVEGSWAQTSSEYSDALGGAYPYDGRLHLGEAYAEASMLSGRRVAFARLGRFRTPFGMSAREDQAYSGFLRPPLVRYGGNFALSTEWLEGGIDLAAGTDRLQIQASAGIPQDAAHRRRNGLDATVRVQGNVGAFIIGLSHLNTTPDRSLTFAQGDSRFTGIDLRWMVNGVEVRGEWIFGRAFAGTATRGGYLDLLVHRPEMGPVSAVVRAEHVAYEAGAFSFERERFVVGGRVRVTRSLSVFANLVAEPHPRPGGTGHALDVGLSLTGRR